MNHHKIVRNLAVLIGFVSGAAFGQEFAAASVKPNRTGSPQVRISRPSPIRFNTENTSLRSLVRFAYGLPDNQIVGGPPWFDNDRWDINASMETPLPEGKSGQEMVRKLMQNLLSERFQMNAHVEDRELPAYVIVEAKTGSKLKPSLDGDYGSTSTGSGKITGTKTPLAELARLLTDQVGRAVVDGTGIQGDFTFQLSYSPDNSPAGGTALDERPNIFTAIQEQLGLKLESRKAKVPVVVVVSAEKATEN